MGVCVFGFGCLSCLDCWLVHVWRGACFLVIAFRVAIVATIRERVNSESDADGSLVSVDLEVRERREKVTVLPCDMLFSSLQEHAVPQFQHCADYR
jgi:hypothetical protein